MMQFVLDVFLATFYQFVALFGFLILFGSILLFLKYLLSNIFYNSIGWKGILLTGWIGTPIHELSHALMCVLFGHRIIELSFFKPDKTTGMLGFVSHSWDTRSLYQSVGNFFIGIAPLIIGTGMIIALLYFILPDLFSEVSVVLSTFQIESFELSHIEKYVQLLGEIIKILFSGDNLYEWRYYVFLYLTLSIASHIAPSPSDFRGMKSGLLLLLLLMVLLNSLATVLSFRIIIELAVLQKYIIFVSGLYILTLLITIGNGIISWLILNAYTLIVKRFWLNPFRRQSSF